LTPARVKPGASGSLLLGVNWIAESKIPLPRKLLKVNALSPISQVVPTIPLSVPVEHGTARANFGTNNSRPRTIQHRRVFIEVPLI